ncbi:MAG: magnesium transporter [Gemmatimonadota bacterium]|nr:magnesium transporter [Gemmatimonadota bacterium]MDH5197352.1 magnesium transporter [Gemmatimonadota bacterium]
MSRNPPAMQALVHRLLQLYPSEAAPLLERHRALDVAQLLERQDPLLAADLLGRLRGDMAAEVIDCLKPSATQRVLGALEPGLAAAIVARLDPEARASRLAMIEPASARELEELMTYPSDVAGGLMDPRVASFRPDTTAKEALSRIRAFANKRIYDVFLVDDEGHLSGSVGLQDLAVGDPTTPLADLAQATPPHVQALAPLDEVMAIVEERRVASLPVVDINNRLLGVIRHADLVTVVQQDATADILSMVGVSREERALSKVSFAVRKRLPWLQINLATAFLAASVVGLFEGTIAKFTALAVLLPVVAGQSGNTGAQALAVTMRGLALREVRVRHWLRIGGKELAVGAINGVAVALVTSLGVYFWSGSLGLALVIGSAMVCSMVVAGVAGASVPMALTVFGQDPAAASSIILTTVTDVMGFMTFLGFATLAAGML